MSSSSNSSINVSIGGLLGVAFVVLKLTGHITWPWIWVLSPFWGPAALLLAILLAFSFASLVIAVLSSR